ncbi:MAG: hypothetical protein LBI40_01870 [Treponema sp.]|nr:hypothetical protein [Treponema sp.]
MVLLGRLCLTRWEIFVDVSGLALSLTFPDLALRHPAKLSQNAAEV